MQITYYCKVKSTSEVTKGTATLNDKSPEEAVAEWNKIYGHNYAYSLIPFGNIRAYYKTSLATGITKKLHFAHPETPEVAQTKIQKWNGDQPGYVFCLTGAGDEIIAAVSAKKAVPQFYYRVHRITGEVTKSPFITATFGQPSTLEEAIDRCSMWSYGSSTYKYTVEPPDVFDAPEFYYRIDILGKYEKLKFADTGLPQPKTKAEAQKLCDDMNAVYYNAGYKYMLELPGSSYDNPYIGNPFTDTIKFPKKEFYQYKPQYSSVVPITTEEALGKLNMPKQLTGSVAGLKLWHMRASERYVKYNFVTFAATKAEARTKIIAKINSEYGHNFAMHLSEKDVYEVGDETVAIIEGKSY